MNKRYVVWSITLILFSLACLCSIDTRRLLLGCYWQECVPERDFHVLDWEIPVALFPIGSKSSDMMISLEGTGEIERGSQNAFWDNGKGSAIYHIYRYPTIRKAILEYGRTLKFITEDWSEISSGTPVESTFSSAKADEFFVVCGIWINGRRCAMLARYQEYIIFFHVNMDEKMTYSMFEKITVYLDEQISSRLYP